jgi:3-methyladenine DNA glycosylase AlkD
MNPKSILQEIQIFCEKNQNPEIVKKYARYFKQGYDAWGVPSELTHKKVSEILGRPDATLDMMLETSYLLVKSPKYEETFFGILLVMGFHKQFTKETFKAVDKWFLTGIKNWAHTDYICGEVIQVFFDKKLITIKDFSNWRTAENKYQRRAVPVSFIKQLKATDDLKPFFDFIDPMMMDPEREVHQGLGWFIREAWKKQPVPAESFLLKWKEKAARLIFQYATEKMTPEQKLKFKRSR